MNIEIRIVDNHYEIRSIEGRNPQWRAAQFSSHAPGALTLVGGNPARYFAPADPLWWLAWWESRPVSIILEGELKSAESGGNQA